METPKPGDSTEREWVRRVQRGERETYARLVETYQRKVFGLVYHLVRRHDEVEDLAQEIFIKAYRAIRSYDGRASFWTWLSRIAVNHCYDYLRRERSARVSYYWQMPEETQRELEAHAESPQPGGQDQAQRTAARDMVDQLLARASAEDRTILVLKELEELSVQEIAEVLDLNMSTVKVRLHRARKRMLEDFERLQQGR